MMLIAGVDITGALVSSAVVAAFVAGLSSFLTQRYLLERKARVDYEFMARKRLNEVIGPLRMQLLFSARDVVRRVRGHVGQSWDMDPSGFYIRSFVYRSLRPLAVAQLIERQMSIADFSVDPAAVALLRFNTTAERMLTGNEIVLDHPDADWSKQSQHLFRDNLRAAATKLIAEEESGPVVIDYARFQREVPDLEASPELRDLTQIFAGCKHNLTNNPLFWLRLVGYAFACSRLIAEHGIAVGFDDIRLPIDDMLDAVDDDRISTRVADYSRVFDAIIAKGL
jgi:hypothetical protein